MRVAGGGIYGYPPAVPIWKDLTVDAVFVSPPRRYTPFWRFKVKTGSFFRGVVSVDMI